MRLSRKLALLAVGAFVLGIDPGPRHEAMAWTSPPPSVEDAVRRVGSDFAEGGVKRLSATWASCIDQARLGQDANLAERCLAYGFGAVLLDGPAAAANNTREKRRLTEETIASGQNEMLEIMGIPRDARRSSLDRYRQWVLESSPSGRAATDIDRPPASTLPVNDPGRRPRASDLAKAADGKYPKDALRRPELADAVRRLIGQPLFDRLNNYSFASPMEFNGRFTVGMACVPHNCGVSEVRYVFSPSDVWIGLVDGGRMRIYGGPPKSARELLMIDRNQAVWRGPVDDTAQSAASSAVSASVNQGQRVQPDGATTEVSLRGQNGTFKVPVTLNNVLTLNFTIDSGASDVSISTDAVEKLMRAGTLSRSDFAGKQTYHLADGSRVTADTFRIRVLKVGDREVRDVLCSVTNDEGSLLLGQSFLTRFRSWSIDNQRQVLLLK